MKLNGLDIRLGPAQATAICAAINGNAFLFELGSGAGASDPHYIWNGSNWALEPGLVTPMQILACAL
jgi:hypothetical protein